MALERVGVPAKEAVFTGDTVWDVRACQKAGVPCIGLLSGDELTAAGAAEVYPEAVNDPIRRQELTQTSWRASASAP